MSVIRQFIFSGCMLLFVSGSWCCKSSAERSAAEQPALEKPADTGDSSKASAKGAIGDGEGPGGGRGTKGGLDTAGGLAAAVDSLFKGGAVYRNNGKDRKSIRLEDGSELLIGTGTTVTLSKAYNQQRRDCLVNGEVYFHIAAQGGGKPFVVYTRNLQIFVLGAVAGGALPGASVRFRVDAFADNAGEEVDLLEGKLKVQKSYHSTTDNEPEILTTGEMVMINRDIDLMEKEKLDSAELAKLNGH